MKYKYKMDDIDCHFCDKKGNLACVYGLCPYIMDSLPELFTDDKFNEAVKAVENYKSPQKNTLKYLRKQLIENGYSLFDKPFSGQFKPDCGTCNYASPGFICYSKKDDTCLKDWIRSVCHAGS